MDAKHTTEDPDNVEPHKTRVWGDYKPDKVTPRCGVCRCCKTVHVKLFAHLSLTALCTELKTNEQSKARFSLGIENYVEHQVIKVKNATWGLAQPEEGEDEATRQAKQEKIDKAAAAAMEENKAKEKATSIRVKRTGVKARGQLVLISKWKEENPTKGEPAPEDLEIRTSRKDGVTQLTYVKVYKDPDAERLDFSEASEDEVRHTSMLDDGSMVLAPGQATRCTFLKSI